MFCFTSHSTEILAHTGIIIVHVASDLNSAQESNREKKRERKRERERLAIWMFPDLSLRHDRPM